MNTTTDHQESASEPLATDTQGAAMRERLMDIETTLLSMARGDYDPISSDLVWEMFDRVRNIREDLDERIEA